MENTSVRLFILYAVCSSVFIYISARETGPSSVLLFDVNSDSKYLDTDLFNISLARLPREEAKEKNESLIKFLQRVVKNHGDKKVAASIYELAQKSMYDLLWMLAGDLDAWLVYDLYKVYSYAQSDQDVLLVFERFRTGNVDRSIVPIVFELDKKYNQFTWWQRVRTRMLINTEKYIAGTLDTSQVKDPETTFGQIAQIASANRGGEDEEEEDDLLSFLSQIRD